MFGNSIRDVVGWWSFVAFLVGVVTGCSQHTAPSVVRVRNTLAEIRSDGSVRLDDGTTGRLLGVRLRPEAETGEPELLTVAAGLVRRGGPVDMEVDEDGRAIVRYRQLIKYRELYAHGILKPFLLGKWADVTVNELLIAMGAAKFERTTTSNWASRALERCAAVQAAADEARWSVRTHVPLSDCRRDPSCLYDELYRGWRPRITLRDNEELGRDLARLEALEKEIEDLRTAGADPGPRLCEAARDCNCFLRRQAAITLGKLGSTRAPAVDALTGLLHDPDARTRFYAAEALGQIGAVGARPALRAVAEEDGDANVRSAAEEALQKLPAQK